MSEEEKQTVAPEEAGCNCLFTLVCWPMFIFLSLAWLAAPKEMISNPSLIGIWVFCGFIVFVVLPRSNEALKNS